MPAKQNRSFLSNSRRQGVKKTTGGTSGTRGTVPDPEARRLVQRIKESGRDITPRGGPG